MVLFHLLTPVLYQKLEHLQSIGRKGNKAGEFDRPRSLAITSEGNIVVADTGNQRVQVLASRNARQGQKEIAALAESRFFLFSATIRNFLPQKATELQNFTTTR